MPDVSRAAWASVLLLVGAGMAVGMAYDAHPLALVAAGLVALLVLGRGSQLTPAANAGMEPLLYQGAITAAAAAVMFTLRSFGVDKLCGSGDLARACLDISGVWSWGEALSFAADVAARLAGRILG